ncbi:MAG: hypothetical protein ACI9OJ_004970, partial [Myxococcota bacterium]
MQALDTRIRIVMLAAGLLIGYETFAFGDTESVTPAVAGETLDAAVRRNVAATLQTTHGLTISDAQTDVRWLDPP